MKVTTCWGRVMGLRTIYGGGRRKKLRVIEPDGQIRHLQAPITIRDLLLQYPDGHTYCVRHVSGSILSMNAELQGGNTYMLLAAQPKKAELMPRSCNKLRIFKAAWKPSLEIICENKTVLHSRSEPKTMQKEKKKVVKPIPIKSNNILNQSGRRRESAMAVPYMVPSGFMF